MAILLPAGSGGLSRGLLCPVSVGLCPQLRCCCNASHQQTLLHQHNPQRYSSSDLGVRFTTIERFGTTQYSVRDVCYILGCVLHLHGQGLRSGEEKRGGQQVHRPALHPVLCVRAAGQIALEGVPSKDWISQVQ